MNALTSTYTEASGECVPLEQATGHIDVALRANDEQMLVLQLRQGDETP